jgi:hypothetical protein
MKTKSRQDHSVRRVPGASWCSPPELVVADLIAGGAEEVRPGVWVSHHPKIYNDPHCIRLKEYDEPRVLRKILWDDIFTWFFASTYRRGLRVAKLLGGYVELKPKRYMDRWVLKSNYRLARRSKTSRLFLKPYVDTGRPVADVKLWLQDRKERIQTKPCTADTDLAAWVVRAQSFWHGRHDPSTGEVSIAPPAGYAGRYVPWPVLKALRKKFGNEAVLMDLIPKPSPKARKTPHATYRGSVTRPKNKHAPLVR